MLPDLALLDDLAESDYRLLLDNLSGIDAAQLDWRPHPAANSVRWIVGHLIWFETWIADAIEGTGRYLSDTGPTAVDVADLEHIARRFDAARARYRALLAAQTRDDLARPIDYFGAVTLTVGDVARVHPRHLAGHRYQVRYIRGAYSRAHGTSKVAFDPW